MPLAEESFLGLLHDHLGLASRPAMTDRLGDLQLDSLARLELWVAFETMAGRWIEPDALDGCETVADLFHFANYLLNDRRRDGG